MWGLMKYVFFVSKFAGPLPVLLLCRMSPSSIITYVECYFVKSVFKVFVGADLVSNCLKCALKRIWISAAPSSWWPIISQWIGPLFCLVASRIGYAVIYYVFFAIDSIAHRYEIWEALFVFS